MVDSINPPADAMANDLSVRFLDSVFGTGWGQRLFYEAPPAGSPGELLSTLFGAINAVVVAGVAFMMLYTLIVAVIASAHEGTPLGRRYHTLWVPIRSVLGVALLMPLPWAKGLAVIQALILLLGWHSLAGASYLSGVALDYLRDKGNGVAVEPFNTLDDVRDMAVTLFPSLVAAEFFAYVDGYPLAGSRWDGVTIDSDFEPTGDYQDYGSDSPGGTGDPAAAAGGTSRIAGRLRRSGANAAGDDLKAVEIGEKDVFHNAPLLDELRNNEQRAWEALGLSRAATALTLSVPVPPDLGRGALGFVRIYCPTPIAGDGASSDIAAQFCDGQKQAVVGMIRAMLPKAADIVARHPFFDSASAAVKPEDVDPIAAGVLQFQDRMADVRRDLLAALYARKLTYLDLVTSYLKDEGWLGLGSWYWTISGFNEVAMRVVLLQPQAFGMRDSEVNAAVMNEMGPYLVAARNDAASNHGHSHQAMVLAAHSRMEEALAQGADSELEARQRGVQELLFKMYVDDVFGHGDILANLQAQGNRILSAVWSALTAANVKGQEMGEAAVEGIAAKMPGGRELSAALGSLKKSGRGGQLSEFAHFLLVPLFLLGMFLAYYIPAVPYLVWALAFVGWLIVFIEAVVAAPLWAAAHAMPEGQGFVGRQARDGYHLLLGILLRPAMMVVGFFIAVVVVNSLAHALLLLFRPVADGLSKDHAMGLISALGTTVVFTGLMVTVIHRVFGLVSWLPDQVMQWFGSRGQAIGADAGQVRGEIGHAASQLGGGAGAAVGRFGGPKGGAAAGTRSMPHAGAEEMHPGTATAAGRPSEAGSGGINGAGAQPAGAAGGSGPGGVGAASVGAAAASAGSVGAAVGGPESAGSGRALDDYLPGGMEGVDPQLTGSAGASAGAAERAGESRSASPDLAPGSAGSAREGGATGVTAGEVSGGTAMASAVPHPAGGRVPPYLGNLSALQGQVPAARGGTRLTDGDAGVNVGGGEFAASRAGVTGGSAAAGGSMASAESGLRRVPGGAGGTGTVPGARGSRADAGSAGISGGGAVRSDARDHDTV